MCQARLGNSCVAKTSETKFKALVLSVRKEHTNYGTVFFHFQRRMKEEVLFTVQVSGFPGASWFSGMTLPV